MTARGILIGPPAGQGKHTPGGADAAVGRKWERANTEASVMVVWVVQSSGVGDDIEFCERNGGDE